MAAESSGGFAGVLVSAPEKAALAEISSVLGLAGLIGPTPPENASCEGARNEPRNAIDDCTPWDACPCGISKSRQARGNIQQRRGVRSQTRRRRTAAGAE